MIFWLVLSAHLVRALPLSPVLGYQVVYGDGTPVAYAYVEILDRTGTRVDSAITDSLGRFLWTPPDPGQSYTLRFLDGTGHGARAVYRPSAQDSARAPTPADRTWTLWQKLLVGWAVFWGSAGTWFYWRGRAHHAHS